MDEYTILYKSVSTTDKSKSCHRIAHPCIRQLSALFFLTCPSFLRILFKMLQRTLQRTGNVPSLPPWHVGGQATGGIQKATG
jgi:hypothetical protein